jgi:hypothetical protein
MMRELDKLAPAVVAMQAALSPVDKSAANPFFKSKYAPLPEVRAAMQPLLAANGLALLTFPAVIDGVNGLHFYLIHESGQYLDGEWLLTPAKRDPQGEGADTTYKRRFGEMAITGLVADEDDDGHAASRPAPQQRAQPNPVVRSDADLKRDELRELANLNGWDLATVAAKFAETVKEGTNDLKKASADEVSAFIVCLESGVVKI